MVVMRQYEDHHMHPLPSPSALPPLLVLLPATVIMIIDLYT
jgi:hypothetical protein